MGGYIMQLQHFSVNDGDGIRTIVFMAGCPLRCAWCANPEGQTRRNAMTHWAETEDILAELRHQAIFFRQSGGGVTFSRRRSHSPARFPAGNGGRALRRMDFRWRSKPAGYFDYAQMAPTLRKMDTIFIDIKHIDPRQHHAFTGVDNALILQNIRRASDEGLPLVVRIPTIVGVNADDETMTRVFDFFSRRIRFAPSWNFLPYHRYGEAKYEKLGLALPDPRFATPSEEQLAHWTAMAEARGIEVVSYK